MITREQHGELRKGRITGSIAQRIMTSSRSAWNTIAEELRNPRPFYSPDQSPNMPDSLKWGHTYERQAAGEFWMRHPEYDVQDPKFIHWHDPTDLHHLRHFGFSPDRLLSRAGLDTAVAGLEIKCPFDGAEHVNNVRALRSRFLPTKYCWQVYMGLWVSGLDYWWFASFDPRAQDEGWRYCDVLIEREHHRHQLRQLESTLNEFLEGFLANENFAPASLTAQQIQSMF